MPPRPVFVVSPLLYCCWNNKQETLNFSKDLRRDTTTPLEPQATASEGNVPHRSGQRR